MKLSERKAMLSFDGKSTESKLRKLSRHNEMFT